jgi:hypothetical protein
MQCFCLLFLAPLAYLGAATPVYAQSIRPAPPTTEPTPPFMRQSVAFVGDFIYRLNYQRTPDNEPMDSTNRQRYARGPYLRELFDEKDARFNRYSAQFSPMYAALAEAFIEAVLEDTARVFLPDAHEQLFAEVSYDMRYRNRLVPVSFYLKRHRKGQAYDWRILEVTHSLPVQATESLPHLPNHADPLTNVPADTDSLAQPDSVVAYPAERRTMLYISSQTHETRFLNLFSHLRTRQDLLRLMLPGKPPSEATQTMAGLIRTGQITVENTREQHLYLNTRRGWVLRLDNFNREHVNSGWLITNLYTPEAPACLPDPIDTYLRQHP